MFSRIAVVSSASLVLAVNAAKARKSWSDTDDVNQPECPVCTYYKQSPCATEFQKFQSCIKKSKRVKKDVTEVCDGITESLVTCTKKNDYFDESA